MDLVLPLLFNQLLFQQILGHLAGYLLHLLPVPLLLRLLPLEDPFSHLLHLFIYQMLSCDHCWLLAFLHGGVGRLGELHLRGLRPSLRPSRGVANLRGDVVDSMGSGSQLR